jgi:hypothetical protein
VLHESCVSFPPTEVPHHHRHVVLRRQEVHRLELRVSRIERLVAGIQLQAADNASRQHAIEFLLDLLIECRKRNAGDDAEVGVVLDRLDNLSGGWPPRLD